MTVGDDDEQSLKEAARQAMMFGRRVFGEGGVIEQLAERGTRDSVWKGQEAPDRNHVLRLIAELGDLGERVRSFRAGMPYGRQAMERAYQQSLDAGLPMNRKERYFTGTVLPAIVSDRNFAHLHRLTQMCGLDVEPLENHQIHGLQFWTEYGFAESCFTDADKVRFPDAPIGRDTPDIVILGPNWLLAIEAKLYDWPAAASLRRQLQMQSTLIDYWARSLGLDDRNVSHVALLPATYAQQLPGLDQKIVTWEEFDEVFYPLVPTYWTQVLHTALAKYDDLVSRNRGLDFGKNADDLCSGAEIVAGFADGSLGFEFMGRAQGINGTPLRNDLESGAWRDRMFEVRREPIDSPNWFPIADFVAQVGKSESSG